MNRIGIFGGAFNPIHNGHLFIANEALNLFGLQKVIFIPTGNPVFPKKDLLNKEDRLELTKIAISDKKYFEVSDFEIKRNELSYFVDTLEYLIEKRHCDDCYSIIGEDAFLKFHMWKNYEKILKLSKIVVAKRYEDNFKTIKSYVKEYFLTYANRILFLSHPLYPISSTLIRDRIKCDKSISYLVPKNVEEEIINNGYYRNR